METHAESGFIVVNCQLQISCQNSKQSQEQQRGRRTRYCETSETSSEDGYDLESSDNPTQAPAVEPDWLHERAVLFDFLAKTNIDSDDSEDNEVDCICSNCKHQPKE